MKKLEALSAQVEALSAQVEALATRIDSMSSLGDTEYPAKLRLYTLEVRDHGMEEWRDVGRVFRTPLGADRHARYYRKHSLDQRIVSFVRHSAVAVEWKK